jgi:hypothetical protein
MQPTNQMNKAQAKYKHTPQKTLTYISLPIYVASPALSCAQRPELPKLPCRKIRNPKPTAMQTPNTPQLWL